METAYLKPSATNGWYQWRRDERVVLNGMGSNRVGFAHAISDPWFGSKQYGWEWWRSNYQFDLGSMPITKAVLHYKTTTYTNGSAWDWRRNCANFVSVANEPWPSDRPPAISLVGHTAPELDTVALDVTSTVIGWQVGFAANNGFLIQGPNEASAEDRDECFSDLRDIELEVVRLKSRMY
jgi:hypothetical protein